MSAGTHITSNKINTNGVGPGGNGFGVDLEGSATNSTGTANISGNVLQLTDSAVANEIHSAFYSNKLSDTNFVTDFGFQVANPFEDGFTFIIQNQSATAVSSGGGGQPLEIQTLEFPSAQALDDFMADDRRQALAGERDRVISRTEIIEVRLVPSG